jgi:hypothetical protein
VIGVCTRGHSIMYHQEARTLWLDTPTLQTSVPRRPLSWGIWKRQVVRHATRQQKGKFLACCKGRLMFSFSPFCSNLIKRIASFKYGNCGLPTQPHVPYPHKLPKKASAVRCTVLCELLFRFASQCRRLAQYIFSRCFFRCLI